MTSSCTVCASNTDAFLCNRCTDRLADTLDELPGWLGELETTATQQAKTTAHDQSKPTKKFEQPLPYHPDAVELLAQARNGITSWVRHVCETRGIDTPLPRGQARQPSTGELADWLRVNIDAVRYDEAAADLYAAVHALRDAIRTMVDTAATRWAGPCTATVVDREASLTLVPRNDTDIDVVAEVGEPLGPPRMCGADLRTRPGAKVITCRECGATYDPVERTKWIIAQSVEHLAIAAFIADALTDAGKPVKAATIRKWAERGKLFAWREDDLGRPLYRVGDVIELVDKATAEGRLRGSSDERMAG